ncbi:MAG: GIY-YIG nuclease family protein [Culicoidibacterales bacterium]
MHYVYMVQCRDQTLYTGYTTNLSRRIHEHNTSPKGAKYTRVRRPVRLVYAKAFLTRQAACQYEYQLKTLTRKQKQEIIKQFLIS